MAVRDVEVPTRAARHSGNQLIVENPIMGIKPEENLPGLRRKLQISLQTATEVLPVLKNNHQYTIFMAKLFRFWSGFVV